VRTLPAHACLLLVCSVALSACGVTPRPRPAEAENPNWRHDPLLDEETPPGLKLAFLGDQGLRNDSRAVLQLVLDEGAAAVVHQGDFDYDDDPLAWERQINAILGPDFPYFASVGNHDEDVFYGPQGYQELLAARLDRLGIPWDGDLGTQCVIRWRGLCMVFTAPGVFGDGDGDHDRYIRAALAADRSTWRICSWHKNQNLMQVGLKFSDTGWGVYEESRRGGAIVATGHEHSYSRTHLLASCEEPVVASTDDTLVLARDDPATPEDEGRTFVFVNGLGGKSIRGQSRDDPWWAAWYTSDQDAAAGVLFGTFHVDGDPTLAYFEFKDIEGRVVDSFWVRGLE
jgi:predicted phosphodiesterase